MIAELSHRGRIVDVWVVSGERLPAPSGQRWSCPKAFALWLAHGSGSPADFVQLPPIARLPELDPRRKVVT